MDMIKTLAIFEGGKCRTHLGSVSAHAGVKINGAILLVDIDGEVVNAFGSKGLRIEGNRVFFDDDIRTVSTGISVAIVGKDGNM